MVTQRGNEVRAHQKCLTGGVLFGRFCVYGTPLPLVPEISYLGIIFDKAGISWEKTLEARAKKAKGTIWMLTRVGFSATDWLL
jgi:hypothetical protein